MANEVAFLARFPFISTVAASQCATAWDLRPLTVVLNAIQALVLWNGAQTTKGFEIAYRVQPVFNLVNLGANFWTFGTLINELGKKCPCFDMQSVWSSAAQSRFSGYGYGAMLVGLVTTIFAVVLIHKKADSYRVLPTIEEMGSADPARQEILKKEVRLSFTRPLGHDLAELIYVSQLCLNLALVVFSSSPVFFVLNLALNGYSLYQFAQRKWLSISRTREWELGRDNMKVKSVTGVYRCFLMPVAASKSSPTELCTICQDPKPDAYFHREHAFHEKCLTKSIVQKSDDFIKIKTFERKEGIRGNVPYVDYEGRMPTSCKPGCHNCREKPFFNELEIFVNEIGSSSYLAQITWVEGDPQRA